MRLLFGPSLAVAGIGLAVVATPAAAQSGSTNISALASIFSSATDLDGSIDNSSLPSVVIALTPGTGRILTFSSITGTIDPANTPHGPDGGIYDGNGVNINSLGSISGVIDSNDRTLALMGAFTSANPATGAAPARLNFTGNHSFATLSPLLNQSFFIGDGLTGTGSGAIQQFFVPDGASFLQLGFADAFVSSNIAFVGDPSAYGDNHGSLTANYSVVATGAAAPEPGTAALLTGSALPLLVLSLRLRFGKR